MSPGARPGARIPTLAEVFGLVRGSGRDDIRLNVETKIGPIADDTAPYRVFTGSWCGRSATPG